MFIFNIWAVWSNWGHDTANPGPITDSFVQYEMQGKCKKKIINFAAKHMNYYAGPWD